MNGMDGMATQAVQETVSARAVEAISQLQKQAKEAADFHGKEADSHRHLHEGAVRTLEACAAALEVLHPSAKAPEESTFTA